MRLIRYTACLTFIWFIGYVMSLPALAQAENANAIGTVVYLKGTVLAEQPDQTNRTLLMDMPILRRDIITTGKHSTIEIRFNDESHFSQGAEARTVIDEFLYQSPETSTLLLKVGVGTVRYLTGKIVQQNPEAFRLSTPLANIGIRGTEVYAIVTPMLEELGVLELSPGHTVEISNAGFRRRITQPNHAVRVTPDQRMTVPGPVTPKDRLGIIQAAPMASRGETPAAKESTRSELENRLKTLESAVERRKAGLGPLGAEAPYSSLFDIYRLKEQQREVAAEKATMGKVPMGSDSREGPGKKTEEGSNEAGAADGP